MYTRFAPCFTQERISQSPQLRPQVKAKVPRTRRLCWLAAASAAASKPLSAAAFGVYQCPHGTHGHRSAARYEKRLVILILLLCYARLCSCCTVQARCLVSPSVGRLHALGLVHPTTAFGNLPRLMAPPRVTRRGLSSETEGPAGEAGKDSKPTSKKARGAQPKKPVEDGDAAPAPRCVY